MEMALDTKNKLGFIDGYIPKPTLIDPMLRIWKRSNNPVASWIINSEIRSSMIYKDLAKAFWDG